MKIVPSISSCLTRQQHQQADQPNRLTKAVQIVALSLAGFGMAAVGYCQTYFLSVPLTSYDRWNAPLLAIQDATYSTNIMLTWNALSETIYLDPVAQTIRQVGFASVNASASNIVLNETRQVPGQFPNPPQTNVPATVTVNIGLVAGGFSFDTGPQPITWSDTAQAYTFDGSQASQPFLVTGSYSLLTGGQTLTGTFNYSIPVFSYAFTAFNKLHTDDYPISVSLDGLGGIELIGTYPAPPAGPFATASASNGVTMQLFVPSLQTYAGWGAATSPVVATNVPSGAASITNQPQSLVVNAYYAASFSVTATGTEPLSYQWSLNGTNISGATASSLTISNVVQDNLGAYAVVVTNAFGSATSSNAVLSMYPFIAVAFGGAVTYWGQVATFGVQAWGTGPLSYQWFQNGIALQNATNQTLTFGSIQATNAGLYSVVVSSALGSVTNTPEQVVVEPAGVSLGFCPALTINGVAGYSYIIQSSTNLADTNAWVTLTNLTLTQPVQLWVDTNVDATSPANSKYFYRVLPGQ